jgi:restriction system protein
LTASELFQRVRAAHSGHWGQAPSEDGTETEVPPAPVDLGESVEIALASEVRSTVLGLSPAGFENLCKRLLTELGLMQLRTVGQAGEKGIDVEGIFG